MSFKIVEVKKSADLDRFIRLPWKIYKDCPNWVPPLVSERKKFLNPQINPFFDRAEVKLFLVEDEKGITLGRSGPRPYLSGKLFQKYGHYGNGRNR